MPEPSLSEPWGLGTKGQSTGIVSVTFKRPGDAAKAVNRFNGTAIDEGARTMKVSLRTNQERQQSSILLTQCYTVPFDGLPTLNPANNKPPSAPPAPAPSAKSVATKAKATKASKPKSKKSARRPKKSVEELDAEMADYFQNSSNA
ncbi:hypothetical protein TRICI_006873 [Trichomonascus ciferrii]|uniref:Chromatin target of PRMT1 protein C-terminal domain-containing protein n=1 Tax=Trichomonascus ciferrii TaxID=44093 RepID=A0A642UC47_9ASCO|nr:hypothetical protein TRICI_006873 [Trichomonascus ciferrii]